MQSYLVSSYVGIVIQVKPELKSSVIIRSNTINLNFCIVWIFDGEDYFFKVNIIFVNAPGDYYFITRAEGRIGEGRCNLIIATTTAAFGNFKNEPSCFVAVI